MSSEGESVKKNGTSELFSPYNLSLKFNYQYSLNERIQAGLSYQYGLSDVGAERLSLYDSQNDQLRLIITYLLIRR